MLHIYASLGGCIWLDSILIFIMATIEKGGILSAFNDYLLLTYCQLNS